MVDLERPWKKTSESPMNNLHLAIEAQNDLRDIKTYITEDLENPQAALAIVRRITKSIRMLREHAYIGAPLSSIADNKEDYRFLVSGSYMVFYRVNGQDVYVDRVLYGRRDYLNVLFRELPEETATE